MVKTRRVDLNVRRTLKPNATAAVLQEKTAILHPTFRKTPYFRMVCGMDTHGIDRDDLEQRRGDRQHDDDNSERFKKLRKCSE
jgi:hypothetical protein